MLFPPSSLGTKGQVQDVTSGTVTGTIGGQSYVGVKPLFSYGTCSASDAWVSGFRYRADGALRVVDATSALPATVSYQGGVALNSIGQLCVAIAAVGSDVVYVNGVPCTNDGRLYVST